MFKATKIKGAGLYDLGDGRFIGVDRGTGPDMHVECEVQKHPDGTIEVLDIRKFPTDDKP